MAHPRRNDTTTNFLNFQSDCGCPAASRAEFSTNNQVFFLQMFLMKIRHSLRSVRCVPMSRTAPRTHQLPPTRSRFPSSFSSSSSSSSCSSTRRSAARSSASGPPLCRRVGRLHYGRSTITWRPSAHPPLLNIRLIVNSRPS